MGTRKPREGIVVRGTEKKYEDTGRLVTFKQARAKCSQVRAGTQPPGNAPGGTSPA